jgi:CRP/FNR family transcriptional regulator, dissimilatory nitrate respiration regulator
MAFARIHQAFGGRGLGGTALADREAIPAIPLASGTRLAAAVPATKAEIDPSAEQRAELIAPLQLFAGLPRSLLEVVAGGGQTLRIAKGCYAFKHGETHKGFYVVVYGKVELLLPKVAQDAKVMAVMEREMSFGEAAMFMDIPFPVSARATEDTMLIFIPRKTLDLVLASRPEFALQLLVRMSQNLHKLVQDIAGYTQQRASNRIAAYLLEQAQQSDKPSIRLPDRKQAIASRLSVAPETLSRTLRQMQEDGIIRVRGYEIKIIDIKGLGQLAES